MILAKRRQGIRHLIVGVCVVMPPLFHGTLGLTRCLQMIYSKKNRWGKGCREETDRRESEGE